ncbi:MAG: AGE family epimerase/isomerase [Verrucomicrobiales bacterium]
MEPEQIEKYRELYRDSLLGDIIPFWQKNGVDHENGGFFNAVDRDGSLLDSDKSVWLQGRFSWLLAATHNAFGPKDELLDLARTGIKFIDEYCFDPEDGLMWFQITADGKPIRKRRYRFSEAFACIANAAVFEATGDLDFARKAADLFATFEAHANDSSLSPFPPKFTGTRPSKGIGAPMIAINMAQICRDAKIEGVNWNAKIDAAISEIVSDFVHDDIECVMETVATDGSRINDHFDGRTLNPGHAIEAAWFILHEAKCRGNDTELIALGTKMLDWMWARGWDNEFGGMLYFVGVDGKPVQEYWHDMKFWWPHDEAIIATLLAYQLTGARRYAEMHQQVHDWTWAHFPDPEFGEWFGYLRRDGAVSSPVKGTLWKGPFHTPRMMLTCWQICEEMLEDQSAS